MTSRTDLVNRRKVFKANLTRLKTYVRGLDAAASADELKEKLAKVISSYDEFDTIRMKLDQLTIQEAEDDEEADIEISIARQTFEYLDFSVVALAKAKIKSVDMSAGSSSSSSLVSVQPQDDTQSGIHRKIPINQKYNLPNMTMPKFDEDYQ